MANRINVAGRMIAGTTKTESGAVFETKKYIKSSTKRGTADIDCNLPNGKNLKIEIKIGRDKPSQDQLKMQHKIKKTGGHYEFIGSMVQFYEIYDRLVSPELFI